MTGVQTCALPIYGFESLYILIGLATSAEAANDKIVNDKINIIKIEQNTFLIFMINSFLLTMES